MRKGRSIVVVVIIVLVAAAALWFVSRKREIDFTGEYLVKVNGAYTGTRVAITEDESGYTVFMEGERGLRGAFGMERAEGDRFVIEGFAGGDKVSEYELRAVKKGLEGTAWVLPVGKIEILFERTRK